MRAEGFGGTRPSTRFRPELPAPSDQVNEYTVTVWVLRSCRGEDAVEPLLWQAIELAREQQAKSSELGASARLAEVLAERGERGAARELLQPIYDWFTEGFDTRDLKVARTLLDQLG